MKISKHACRDNMKASKFIFIVLLKTAVAGIFTFLFVVFLPILSRPMVLQAFYC